jgi:hypothetical protein
MQPGGKFIFLSSGSATVDQVPRGYEVTYGISKVSRLPQDRAASLMCTPEWSKLPGMFHSQTVAHISLAKHVPGSLRALRGTRPHHLPT